MGYDCGDSFPSDFEPYESTFGSKSKENCHHDYFSHNLKITRPSCPFMSWLIHTLSEVF